MQRFSDNDFFKKNRTVGIATATAETVRKLLMGGVIGAKKGYFFTDVYLWSQRWQPDSYQLFFVRLVLPVFIMHTPVDINDFRGVPATHVKYIG